MIGRIINILYVYIFLILMFNNAYAQINFRNPSFEETKQTYPPALSDTKYWGTLSGGMGVFPDTGYYDRILLPAYNGRYYVGFDDGFIPNPIDSLDTLWDSMYQTLSCTLQKGITYSFSYYGYNWYNKGNTDTLGGIRIWLADDKLNKVQIIFKKYPLTTKWKQYTVNFKPAQTCRNIIIEGWVPGFNQSGLCSTGIDYLSPITFNNKAYITARADKKVLYSPGAVHLSCIALHDTALTVSWQSLPAGLHSSDSSVTVMPLQTTQYIVTGTFSCGLQVSDTVTVVVDFPDHTVTGQLIKNYPNIQIPHGGGGTGCTDYVQTIISGSSNWQVHSANTPIKVTLCNAPGQLLYVNDNYQNNYNPTQSWLAAGVYFYIIEYGSGYEVRGKLVYINN